MCRFINETVSVLFNMPNAQLPQATVEINTGYRFTARMKYWAPSGSQRSIRSHA